MFVILRRKSYFPAMFESRLLHWANARLFGCGLAAWIDKNSELRVSLDSDVNRQIMLDRVLSNEPETERMPF